VHLEDLNPAYFLEIVANLQTLDVGVALEVGSFQQFKFINVPKFVVVYLFAGRFPARIIERCLKLDGYVVGLSFLCCKDTSLDVVDYFRIGRA